ncbi:heavy metal translocating P-type ATPase [Microbacterium sp. ASV49]|uniref:Heavy metal translocating P-type ATPase n=1 Tax=Microbacterium candidum TaxID=3041922 RepID=A0ABT7N398_9MICO|nr:heavy metal translocating P-type ATPase [Microbacterium sp. ASV49]MDL9981151.1 heavy metal translocating P-type ATPase [Microbacterium sp. ASV49]
MTDLREATLDIEGMTCASCVARVEKRLQSVDGVSAAVNLATESAKVSFPVGVDEERLVQAVREAGYDAHVRVPAVAPEAPADEPVSPLRLRLIVSAILAVPVVALGMIPALQFPGWQWASFVLATPVVLWGGWPFHRATIANARHGAMTMDTLITLGTLAAYVWSVWAMVFGTAHESYFEVAVTVTVFLLLGRFIEQRSKRRAGSALRALMSLGVKDVELADGRSVPIEELRVGDEFVVRPGGKVATDGVVVGGAASVDESMLTGESVPVDVEAGASVTGGTIAADGRLVVRATSVGEDTRLAHIARLVEDAQTGKSRVQRLADRISGVFVPIVIALSILTLLGWIVTGHPVADGFTAAVAVLIIACPCALGLATPIAILVGTGRGAQLGILVTGPEALEQAEKIDTVVLDKTGTVTEGRMALADVAVDGIAREEALRIVGALEAHSEHPVAKAIAAWRVGDAEITGFRNHAGRGVTGTVDGLAVFAGRPAFAASQGAVVSAALADAVASGEAHGTVVVAGWDGHARAVFAVADTVRPESADVIASLHELKLDVVLLTGDNASVAQSVADEVGIDRVVAGVLPEGKVDEIARLQAAGHRVAMVGDGVNDAAALATADLGIAVGSGTDAAMHASDLTLMRDGLEQVDTALRLSRRTMGVIRGNLFWAFAYNVAAIPLAALGLLNPMIAGAAMAFSSVFVVLNSLRLRRAP